MELDIKSLKSESQPDFIADHLAKQQDETFESANALWQIKKGKALFIINTAHGEIIYGDDLNLSDNDVIGVEDLIAKNKEPYGDVPYADPGYKEDKKKRYPIDTEEHIRAAHNYFSKPSNYEQYTPEQRAKIKARISAAWRRVIDPKGPPSDQKK